jgi:hypothetical protein
VELKRQGEDIMRVLAVRQPWASLIINGHKSIEVRSQNTRIRDSVQIYASKSKPRKEDMEQMKKYFHSVLGIDVPDNMADLPFGKIIGQVIITSTDICTSKDDWDDFLIFHLCPDSYFSNKAYFWFLDYIDKFEEPIDYQMPQGCVVWANA